MSTIARWFTPSKSDQQSGAQYNAAYTAAGQSGAQPLSGTVVDSSATNQQLGRAALISTSPQGVSGTDPTLRYKLLGNSTALGN